MTVANVPASAGLDFHDEELTYSYARLMADDRAKAFAPLLKPLIKRNDELLLARRALTREAVAAQAVVDAHDDQLDDKTAELNRFFLGSVSGREDKRFKLYFKKTASLVVRLGLESQLDVARAWADLLPKEPEAALKSLGSWFKGFQKSASEAIELRRTASLSRAEHRARELQRYLDDHNAIRRSIYGKLVVIAAEQGLPKDWPNRFFRTGSRGSEPAPPPEPPAPPVTE
jgi:hypothetical protein